jgi:signal transduction histidine kinase
MVGQASVRLDVSDNGRGIAELPSADENRLGLLGMQERASTFGGRVVISSSPPRGTRVRVWIPFDRQRGSREKP